MSEGRGRGGGDPHAVAAPGPGLGVAARRWLRGVLVPAGHEEWLDTAELACTELVSNAVLHAHTPVDLAVHVGEDELLVEVHDRSPMLPVQRAYDSLATTGRGMGLVAALVAEHGIRDAGPEGKTAWFVLRGRPGDAGADDLLDAWDDSAWDDSAWDDATSDAVRAAAGPGAEAVPGVLVRLLGIPPTLWFAAREHHDTILRELALHLADGGRGRVTRGPRPTWPPPTWPAARCRPRCGPSCTTGATARPGATGGTPAGAPGGHGRARRTSRCSCRPRPSGRSRACRTRWTWPSGWRRRASCSPGRRCPRSSRCATGPASRWWPSTPGAPPVRVGGRGPGAVPRHRAAGPPARRAGTWSRSGPRARGVVAADHRNRIVAVSPLARPAGRRRARGPRRPAGRRAGPAPPARGPRRRLHPAPGHGRDPVIGVPGHPAAAAGRRLRGPVPGAARAGPRRRRRRPLPGVDRGGARDRHLTSRSRRGRSSGGVGSGVRAGHTDPSDVGARRRAGPPSRGPAGAVRWPPHRARAPLHRPSSRRPARPAPRAVAP